ncbi:CoA transferase family III [Streptomyces sp. BK208]|uniref:CoA transferase n=1 Tax=Streptomyces sp. BK208 TaxID=2512150 RepID=UPI00105EBF08|nr:CoA transferase [Streptomyces sp. BK208]TDT29286.1 CoA transferase family III [Streptomyces sp. BK208]
MTFTEDAATAHAWAALGGRRRLVRRVSFEGPGAVLPSRLPVRELARAAVAVASLAAAELLSLRNRVPVPAVRVDEGAVATAFVSERHLRVDGRAPAPFAPLSGFWQAADGWVRTHANYPHHRARLLGALGLADTGQDRALVDTLARELASRPALEIQETVYAAGGLAVAVASAPAGHPPAGPVPAARRPPGAAGAALVETRNAPEGDPRLLVPASLPARGVRVLDLTRVIAGPVATRTLALLGADVLRVDAPQLVEDAYAHADTGLGKRSTLLDLADPGDRRSFEDLLSQADVVVTGYRPGALDRHGLAPDALLARRPDLIVAQLCAWGWSGPWAGRRGFDSLVQAGAGIAAIEAGADGRPGVLPAQALDHGTGYLLAAAVLRALSDRHATGGGRHLRLSLAGTASWLLDIHPASDPGGADLHDPGAWLTETASPYGPLRHALPPVHYEGAPSNWNRGPTRWGTDLPNWA